jgi:hypothetical protein
LIVVTDDAAKEFKMRPLDRELINRIVEAEKNPPDISTVDPALRAKVQGDIDEWKQKNGRTDYENSSLAFYQFYWGHEYIRLRDLWQAELAELRRIGPIDPVNGSVIREMKPIPIEIILAYGYCVEANPVLWNTVEIWRAVHAREEKLKGKLSLQDYVDDPDRGVKGFAAAHVLIGYYRAYFRLKYAWYSDQYVFEGVHSILFRGKIEEFGEEEFLRRFLVHRKIEDIC